jgi:predicted RNA binding protein YcfA (HicA-like mRNA interferase family)
VTRLPRITGREVISTLRRAGFEVARIKGSHHFLRHSDGRGTVVPVHAGETIGPGLRYAA